jgi:Domain of unknown function (DUF4191)
MVKKPGAAASEKAASKKTAAGAESAGRLKQIGMVAGIVRKANPKALPIVFGIAIAIIAIVVVVALATDLVFLIPLGVLLGLLGAMIAFGRFAQSAQYATIAGQPGAAAAILQSMRGNWTVTPAIAANKSMDIVHRAVGRPGVILVGEGSPNRLPGLLAAEKKRVSRVALDVPIYDIQAGDEAGQIPIKRLQRHIMKLPRNLKGPAVADLNYRLKALPQSMQMPKGPMPRSARMPKAPKPRFR